MCVCVGGGGGAAENITMNNSLCSYITSADTVSSVHNHPKVAANSSGQSQLFKCILLSKKMNRNQSLYLSVQHGCQFYDNSMQSYYIVIS